MLSWGLASVWVYAGFFLKRASSECASDLLYFLDCALRCFGHASGEVPQFPTLTPAVLLLKHCDLKKLHRIDKCIWLEKFFLPSGT